MSILHKYICALQACLVPMEGAGSLVSVVTDSCEALCVGVLGTKPRSFVRATNALSCWANSPAPITKNWVGWFYFFRNDGPLNWIQSVSSVLPTLSVFFLWLKHLQYSFVAGYLRFIHLHSLAPHPNFWEGSYNIVMGWKLYIGFFNIKIAPEVPRVHAHRMEKWRPRKAIKPKRKVSQSLMLPSFLCQGGRSAITLGTS